MMIARCSPMLRNETGRVMAKATRQKTRAEQVGAMADEYVQCRAWGHLWRVDLAYGARSSDGTIHRNWARAEATCERCEMQVTRVYDQAFGLLTSIYRRPRGYDVVGQGYAEWRREARQEAFTRALGLPGRRTRSP